MWVPKQVRQLYPAAAHPVDVPTTRLAGVAQPHHRMLGLQRAYSKLPEADRILAGKFPHECHHICVYDLLAKRD
jgi:hypothetical protein